MIKHQTKRNENCQGPYLHYLKLKYFVFIVFCVFYNILDFNIKEGINTSQVFVPLYSIEIIYYFIIF